MFLIQLGVCPMLVAACIVAQMCPDIHLAFLDSTCKISQRTLGALTGSRLAGAFGFVCVSDCMIQRISEWSKHCFSMGGRKIVLSSWIDNCYAFSKSACGAISIIEDMIDKLLLYVV